MEGYMKFYIGAGLKSAEIVKNIASRLTQIGWEHTYDWTKDVNEEETTQELTTYAKLEQQAIYDSDIVIIVLPGGRGTHIELGMALALNKKIYLYSAQEETFSIENTVDFYELPCIHRVIGSIDELTEKIISME